MSGRQIAAFDFDGTLTRRDALVPFLVKFCGAPAVARALARTTPTGARARLSGAKAEVHHRDAFKAALLADLLTGRDAAELAEAGVAFAAGLDRRLRPEMVDQVQWHLHSGHELVIVSASLLAYLDPFAQRHGFHQVLAVGLEVGTDGLLTGQMTGPNVRGAEKVVRLKAWLGGDEPACLWAYGNSSGDADLLAMADMAVWVNGYRPSPAAPLPRPAPAT